MDDLIPSIAHEDALPHYLFDIWHILTSICNRTSEVYGAMLKLEDIININKFTDPLEVEVILL